MSDKKRKPTAIEASRALRDTLLEASGTELNDAIEGAGLDAEQLAHAGRSAVRRGLRRALEFPATDVEADSSSPSDDESLHKGLGALVLMLRRRDALTQEQLAERARVDLEDIQRIESDPTFAPGPRTLFQLEQFFKLRERSLAVLSGAIRARSDETLRDEVVKFAAHCPAVAKLTREEKKLLNNFVKFLAKQVN